MVNVGVILLGALVRATGSGAGCGRSWPTCEGELVPSLDEAATAIEFLHRTTSGVALLVVLFMYLSVRRSSDRGTAVRTAAFFSVVTIIIEALIGAGIVLFEWVADDASVARTIAVPLHLVNTLLLLAALTSVVYLVGGRSVSAPDKPTRTLVLTGLGVMVLTAATGAVAALADTLFPVESVAEGLVEDFSSTAHFLTRLRVVHPVIAVLAGLTLIWIVSRRDHGLRESSAARAVTWLVIAQIGAGLLNVVLLVPVWMQLVHLFLADALWISFVWFSLAAMTERQSSATSSS